MHLKFIFFYGLSVFFLFTGCGPSLPEEIAEVYQKLPDNLDYNLDVKPVLSDKCFLCHGPDKNNQKAGLRLDIRANALGELPENEGKYAITPGNLRKSEVFHRILSGDPEYKMPTAESKLNLSPYEKAVLIKWIEEGAEYKPHWAFIKPRKRKLPRTQNKEWARNPVDQFILKKLEQKGLNPSPEAEKAILLRRLSFDLTGLPPGKQELEAFLKDTSEQAYEKQVDRLLASPHYGERMAVDWLDLARYADTHGYLVDRYRDMSPWRDWVISAFNDNMPYDQFITWQLAGDLFSQPQKEQILATGFNRLHPQNLEGGIIDEEFRVAYVSDRTDVVGTGLLGLTLSCAKCHDHKFDPVSQKEYYQLYAFFNNVNESGQIPWDWSMPVPTLMIPDSDQEKILAFLEKKVAEKETGLEKVRQESSKSFETWMQTEAYQNIPKNQSPPGMVAHIDFEKKSLRNTIYPRQTGKMDRKASANEVPVFTSGKRGDGLLLDGDAWLDLDEIGVYKRNQPFSISIEVFLPKDLKDGFIFHKGMGTRLHSYRGYHLYIKDHKLELMMAHTWPDNAIVEYAADSIPREEWVQFTVTYDGSSKAEGLRLFMNGRELNTEVEIDNLYKDIIFRDFEDYIYPEPIEPGLQIGARWRGKGLRGAKVDDIRVFDRELTQLEIWQQNGSDSFLALTGKSSKELAEQDRFILYDYFINRNYPAYQSALDSLEYTREVYIDSMEQVQEVMIMKEMPKSRKAYILERGQYNVYGEEVSPNTPGSILAMSDSLPQNRLGLAKWLVSPENPLTARVAVNRYWQIIFGRGLVKTTEDFGNQGELPTHPDLLDWLAVEFMESDWNVKDIVKLMVMSATYRQDSRAGQQLKELDSENIWLARGPSLRLPSEMIRDNALASSGLLNPEIGGESVKPYQPEGLWKMNNAVYEQDSGKKLYRRSMYILWKRSVPHPTLATFDVPDRSECTVRRQRTTTPLQALALLNDPAFVEASKVLGEKITRSANTGDGIREVFFSLTGRSPEEREMDILLQAHEQEYQNFLVNDEKTKGWLSAGEYTFDASLDKPSLAAGAIIASTIMNADASITKR